MLNYCIWLQAMRPWSRRLSNLLTHPQAVDTNTVYATVQINAGSNSRTQAVMADFRASMAVTPPYGVVPVQASIQFQDRNAKWMHLVQALWQRSTVAVAIAEDGVF